MAERESHLTGNRSRLWLWFVAAFVVQLGAWAAWFVIAAHHQVEEVPLATHPSVTAESIRNPQSEIRN